MSKEQRSGWRAFAQYGKQSVSKVRAAGTAGPSITTNPRESLPASSASLARSGSALCSHRLLERHLEAGRKDLCGTVGGDDHDVFAANAKFTRDVDARLVRKGHPRYECCFARAHKVGMLVAVETDAVAKAVCEEFVVGTITRRGDHRASGVVNRAGKLAGAGAVEGRTLGLADDFVGALDFFGRLAGKARAGDIGLIAFDRAAAIDENDLAFP